MSKNKIIAIITITILFVAAVGTTFVEKTSTNSTTQAVKLISKSNNPSQTLDNSQNTIKTSGTQNQSHKPEACNPNDSSENSITNTSNNNNSTNNSATTNSTIQNNTQFTMNLGNGNFSSLLENTSFFYGQAENGAIMIINLGSIVNDQLIGTEYYLGEPNEKFNVKISSIGNNNYIIYEFYQGQHTGTFKVSSQSNSGTSVLTGTYIKAGTSNQSNVTLHSNNLAGRHSFQMHGLMDNYPYYNFNVNATNVTWVNINNGEFFEFYSGDPNAFIIQPNVNYNSSNNYAMIYTETYKGVKTGEYYLNYNKKTNEHYGKYVKYENGQAGQSYNITLQGSTVPTYYL